MTWAGWESSTPSCPNRGWSVRGTASSAPTAIPAPMALGGLLHRRRLHRPGRRHGDWNRLVQGPGGHPGGTDRQTVPVCLRQGCHPPPHRQNRGGRCPLSFPGIHWRGWPPCRWTTGSASPTWPSKRGAKNGIFPVDDVTMARMSGTVSKGTSGIRGRSRRGV